MTAILILSSFITATVSGILGLGGGFMLFAVMANFYPPAILIPLHGIIQLTSNLSRSALGFNHINWKIVWPFAVGAILGAAIGSQAVLKIPLQYYYTLLGIFITLLTWVHLPAKVVHFPGKFFFVGAVATFLSMVIGAVGPAIAPFYLREGLKKEGLIATKAISQVALHTFKVSAFFLVGVNLGPHLGDLGMMIVATIAGSYFGKYLLGKIDERIFQLVFKIIITVLALRLIWQGLQQWN